MSDDTSHTPRVSVIDYGIGNLLSVSRALERCGAAVELVHTPEAIAAADRLVLPGVGAFKDGMEGLRARGFVEPIRQFAAQDKPFLGICLGMQMMFDASEEFGEHEGIGLIPGHVVPIPKQGVDGKPHKIPHIGWNRLRHPESTSSENGAWQGTMLDGVDSGDGAYCYFVHSFMGVPNDPAHRLADCDYDGIAVSAMVRRGKVYGSQFHPEKSGEIGLAMIRNWLAL